MHHFHAKLPYQKPRLRQIEWWVQNGPIAKNGVLPVTALFFWKFSSSLITSYADLIWCASDPNAHIRAFCKRWSFIWRCFFSVSLMKLQAWRPAILWKGDSTKGVFLRSFRNFKNTLFCRTTAMAASEAQKTRQHTIPWYISQ